MVEAVCREVRQNSESFGGLQIIFVGDFFQLPPVVRREEESPQTKLIQNKNESIFACDSRVWQNAQPVTCYITEQYRQDDVDFLAILSAIRQNTFNKNHLQKIQSRKVEKTKLPKNVPKLFSHNINVDFVNIETLSKIDKETEIFEMLSQGPEALVAVMKKGCLSPEKLELKIGAEVMFTKNNQKEGYVNGTLGTVVDFAKGTKYPMVRMRNGRTIEVESMEWALEENGKIRARINQIPLRLAWAITVHKSQGMSMDSAIMDLSEVFEYGQGYVALSRVRRLSGLYILGLNEKAFKVHPDILLKDETFRGESEKAGKIFGKIFPAELAKMHNNFITAFGGRKLSKKKK
jgi:ATP-dependent exoDNAse (exonuclease V) alpha subunit